MKTSYTTSTIWGANPVSLRIPTVPSGWVVWDISPVGPALHGSVNLPEARVIHVYNFEKWGPPGAPGRPPRGALKLSLLTRSIKISLPPLSPHYHHNATVARCPATSLYCLALCLDFKVIEGIGVGFWKESLLLLRNKFNVIRVNRWTETFRLINEFILWLKCCKKSGDYVSCHNNRQIM